MKVSGPACKHVLPGRQSDVGTRVACTDCKHSFFWTDSQRTGKTFVLYDLDSNRPSHYVLGGSLVTPPKSERPRLACSHIVPELRDRT